MSEMNAWSLAQARDALRAKQVTSVELTEACLSAIEGADALGAFVHKTPELALDLARAADEKRELLQSLLKLPHKNAWTGQH